MEKFYLIDMTCEQWEQILDDRVISGSQQLSALPSKIKPSTA
jgi:hypothetical protein